MWVIIGMGVVFGSLITGFTMAGGKVAALVQISEFITIGGCALGAVIVGSGLDGLKAVLKRTMGVMKPSPYTKAAFLDLLKMLNQILVQARREGVFSLEEHAERPHESHIFKQCPLLANDHEMLSFLSDTLRMVVMGVEVNALDEMVYADLDVRRHENQSVMEVVQKTSDAMPGFGIVAAVLGVVITMGSVGGGDTGKIGEEVAKALVGTFLGVLLAYGVFGPLAQAMTVRNSLEAQYLECMRAAMVAMARGTAPLEAIDYARRSIEPSVRCTFEEMERAFKGGAAPAAEGA